MLGVEVAVGVSVWVAGRTVAVSVAVGAGEPTGVGERVGNGVGVFRVWGSSGK